MQSVNAVPESDRRLWKTYGVVVRVVETCGKLCCERDEIPWKTVGVGRVMDGYGKLFVVVHKEGLLVEKNA